MRRNDIHRSPPFPLASTGFCALWNGVQSRVILPVMATALEYLVGVEGGPPGAIRYALRSGIESKDFNLFCGFIPGTVRAERLKRVGGKWQVEVRDETTPTPDAARNCVVVHQDNAESVNLDTQAGASGEIWEIEVRLRNCSYARNATDAILRQLESDGVLRALIARYDEAGDALEGQSWGGHSAVVALPGVCPHPDRAARSHPGATNGRDPDRWADVELVPDGSGRVAIRRSKTDQEGAGAVSPNALQAILEPLRDPDVFPASPSDAVQRRGP